MNEAMIAVEATNERWFEAEVNRVAGEIALIAPEAGCCKSREFSVALSQSPANNKPNPGNCAPQ